MFILFKAFTQIRTLGLLYVFLMGTFTNTNFASDLDGLSHSTEIAHRHDVGAHHSISDSTSFLDTDRIGKSIADPNFQVLPGLFADGHQHRFITALTIWNDANLNQNAQGLVDDNAPLGDQDSKNIDRTIYLHSANLSDTYYVDDQKQGMLFLEAFGGVTVFGGLNVMGGGIALVALFEGESISHRQVVGLKNAEKVHALKRPKKISDLEDWQIGDRLQYVLGIGGMAPIGIGTGAVGVSFAPIAQARWRVAIEKISDTTMRFDFTKEKNYGCKLGVGNIFINSSATKLSVKAHETSYRVDISTKEGQASFEELMRYRHMFHGGMKDYGKLKEEDTQNPFIELTENGDITLKVVDRKKLRVKIPFLFSYSTGTKTDKIKATSSTVDEEILEDCQNPQFCERKTRYRILNAPNIILKSKYHQNPQRLRQQNAVSQGFVSYHNGQRILMAEATLKLSNNRLRDRHYIRAMKRLDSFLDLKRPLSDMIIWPNDAKHDGSFVVSLSLKIDHDGINSLLANKDQLKQFLFKENNNFAGSAQEFIDADDAIKDVVFYLGWLKSELMENADQDSTVASVLRTIINKIRKNNYLMRAVETLSPGILKASVELHGTNICPMTQKVNIVQ